MFFISFLSYLWIKCVKLSVQVKEQSDGEELCDVCTVCPDGGAAGSPITDRHVVSLNPTSARESRKGFIYIYIYIRVYIYIYTNGEVTSETSLTLFLLCDIIIPKSKEY